MTTYNKNRTTTLNSLCDSEKEPTPEESYVKEYCDRCMNDTICTERGYVTKCIGFCKEK